MKIISNRNEDPRIVMICDRGELKLWLPRGVTSSASRNKENAGLSSKLEIALEEKIALGIIRQTLTLVEDLRSGETVQKAKAEAKLQSGATLQNRVTLRGHDHLQEVLTRVISHHRVSFTYRVSVVRVRVVQTGIPPCAGFIKVETVLRVRIASFCTLSLPALPTSSLPLLLLLLLIPHERIRRIRKIRIKQELPWNLLSRAESEPRDSFVSRWG